MIVQILIQSPRPIRKWIIICNEFSGSSLEDSQSETITDQPVGDRAIARNEGMYFSVVLFFKNIYFQLIGAILRLQDSETQQSLLKGTN